MKLRTLIIVAAAVAAIACGTEKPVELVPVELQTVATVDRISDTTFFSSPWSIKESSGDIYFLDATLNRVLRLDNDLRFRNYIGAKGRADNEFAMPTLMAISDDSVAVYDQSGKIKFFSAEGKYLGCTPLDKDAPTGDFAMQDGCIYFPTINVAQSAFVRLSDGVCTPFGTVDRDGDPTMLSIKNGRYIYIHGDRIIAVSQFYLEIEVYERKSLQLEERIPYDDIPLVQQNIRPDYMPSSPSGFVGITPVIRDCCVHGDRMYMSVPDRINGKYNCNKVIAFDIGRRIRPTALYILGDGSYGSICADDKYIYAFDMKNSTICKIALP